MVKVEVNLTKGAVLFFALMFIIVALTLVYAYGSGDPAFHGHDMGEIAFTCQTVTKTCASVQCSVECPSGYIVTGGGFGNDEVDSSHIDWDIPLGSSSGNSGKEGWYAYAYNSNPTKVFAICCNMG